MKSNTQESICRHVAEDSLEEAIKLVAIELKQHITWTVTYVAAAQLQCLEGKDSLQQALQVLNSMNNFIVNELIIERLLPRTEDLKDQ